jgi:outer membrane protein, adhesin transport system
MIMRACLYVIAIVAVSPTAGALTLREAVDATASTHPAVLAAQANRRATAFELLQAQGRKLPRVDLDADIGEEKIDRPQGLSPEVNDTWRTRRQANLTLTQPIFDGWDRINDIYRNAARVDAASFRVLARAEVLALEAVEAYINVLRSEKSLTLAEAHVNAHRRILGRVREQAAEGKIPASEIDQVQERLAAAQVTVERVHQSLQESEVAFFRVVGAKPTRLQTVALPASVPVSRDAAISAGLAVNPLIGAAGADADVARLSYKQTKSTEYPFIGLEVKGSSGHDLAGTPGRSNELAAKFVLRWNVFDGLISRNRQSEFAERWSQAQAEAEDRRRSVSAEIERSLVAYQGAKPRLDALRRQTASAQKVVSNYEIEYSVGKRTLLELLNSETALFNAKAEVVNMDAVHVFSAYRVLGAIGSLIETVKAATPAYSATGALAKARRLGRFGNAAEPLKHLKPHGSWLAHIVDK